MKTLIGVIMLTLLSAVGTVAQTAPDQTAGKLADMCKHSASVIGDLPNVDAFDGWCTGQILGWRNVIDELPVLDPARKNQLHIDSTANTGQLIRVFVSYVKTHPAIENKESFLVFTLALRDAGLMTLESAKP